MAEPLHFALWLAVIGWLIALLAVVAWYRQRRARRLLRAGIERRLGVDVLTGLATRAGFLARAEHEVNRSQRAGHALSVLLVEVDDMRHINAQYGHHGGDLALRHVAEVCRAHVRDFDVCGRFSSQEIAILLPDTKLVGARKVLERIRQQVATSSVQLEDGRSFPVGASIGVAELVSDVEDAEDLLLAADGSLRRAKARRDDETDVLLGG
ncbi:GGDEF domain-containing protein [Chitinolyticbacter meiyuanensis]|uniref:GGDEF domain-containing protein n=1 Tax=Chitinolyticbacter meiyuanensis TaxID=682798 RepID=UPI0011E5E82E|nr:GGDEF domain-containing protein [Chitinolyticbacter meiyuanensis]